MTRYSTSRGIMYSTPPNRPSDEETDAAAAPGTEEPAAADD